MADEAQPPAAPAEGEAPPAEESQFLHLFAEF